MRKKTLGEVQEKYESYKRFSCKPLNKKIKVGSVIDEEKSVRWNREYIEKHNKKVEEEVKNLQRKKNHLREEVKADACTYIMQETKVSKEKALSIYTYVEEKWEDENFYGCLSQLDDLLELIKTILF